MPTNYTANITTGRNAFVSRDLILRSPDGEESSAGQTSRTAQSLLVVTEEQEEEKGTEEEVDEEVETGEEEEVEEVETGVEEEVERESSSQDESLSSPPIWEDISLKAPHINPTPSCEEEVLEKEVKKGLEEEVVEGESSSQDENLSSPPIWEDISLKAPHIKSTPNRDALPLQLLNHTPNGNTQLHASSISHTPSSHSSFTSHASEVPLFTTATPKLSHPPPRQFQAHPVLTTPQPSSTPLPSLLSGSNRFSTPAQPMPTSLLSDIQPPTPFQHVAFDLDSSEEGAGQLSPPSSSSSTQVGVVEDSLVSHSTDPSGDGDGVLSNSGVRVLIDLSTPRKAPQVTSTVAQQSCNGGAEGQPKAVPPYIFPSSSSSEETGSAPTHVSRTSTTCTSHGESSSHFKASV